MIRRAPFLTATLALAAACAAPAVPPPPSSPASSLTAPTRPTLEAAGASTTPRPEEICAEAEILADVITLGACAGVVSVGVRAGAEELARELLAKYGDAIKLSVGLFPYPSPDDPERACVDIRPIAVEHPPLVAAVELDSMIVAGAHYEGTVHLTNAGPVPFELQTSSSFSLFLFRPGESDPIGTSELGTMGTGYGTPLAPGASISLPATGGTASCDLAVGYVVPAAEYEVRALVGIEGDPEEELLYFWSDPTAVEVVNG